MMLACHSCNLFKGTQFDLETGVRRLSPRLEPWSHPDPEPAMLVDPTREAPNQHLTYVFEFEQWRIAALSDRGLWTIRKLRLDRASLTNHATSHVSGVVHPVLERVFEAEHDGDMHELNRQLNRLRELAHADRPWAQLVRCVIREVRAGTYPPPAQA